jgi:CheY-like chemotaxis protein
VGGQDGFAFRVEDSGIGMSSEALGRIFQPFTQADSSMTRKYGGTGLGLTISRSLCHLMGGTLDVESEAGRGSTFTVRLPARWNAAVAEPSEPPALPEPSESPPEPRDDVETVLVIDDEPIVCELMKRFLAKEGFHVITALSGREGLRLAREHRLLAITLDVMMPEMDGWTILSVLKNDPDLLHIPVIMVTMVDDKNIGFALGATEFMTKPVDYHRLAAMLNAHRAESLGRPILIVDDDDATRRLIQHALEREGWTIVEAVNGQAALENVRRVMPAAILLDLLMPEMDGFEFLALLRANPHWKSIPVIVLTAKQLDERDYLLLSGRVERILSKGLDHREDLLREVSSLIRTVANRRSPATITATPETG